MYDFEITETPGIYVVSRGSQFVGDAFKRKGGHWTFQPKGHSAALLEAFKTKNDIARYIEAHRT